MVIAKIANDQARGTGETETEVESERIGKGAETVIDVHILSIVISNPHFLYFVLTGRRRNDHWEPDVCHMRFFVLLSVLTVQNISAEERDGLARALGHLVAALYHLGVGGGLARDLVHFVPTLAHTVVIVGMISSLVLLVVLSMQTQRRRLSLRSTANAKIVSTSGI